MKRYCKNIDITNRDFIKKAVLECLKGGKNGRNKMGRNDTLRMFRNYSGLPYQFLKTIADSQQFYMFDGIINTVTEGIREEILSRDYRWKEIWHSERQENDKIRRIGIQDIKQQLYDYIAVDGLMEVLNKKIGQFQCAAISNRGQVYGKNAIKKWLRNRDIRYVWKGDAKHYYENIDIARLKSLLTKYVKNEPLLHLVFSLIDSFEKGLEIGSYLSQYLANFYMSFAYHYVEEHLFKERNCRSGESKRVPLVYHQLYYMDDIALFGKSLKDLKKAAKLFCKWIWDNLGIEIKDDARIIDLRDGYIDMMGFCISRKKVIARGRIFRRYRRGINQIKKEKCITLRLAHRLVSLDGWMKNSNGIHWRKRNKANQIIKICKEVIKHEKDVVQLISRSGKYYSVA